MTSPIKSVRLSGVSPKSLMLTIGVIALVVVLFFIPELIDLQKSLFSGSGSTDSKSQKAPAENVLSGSEASPLEKVSGLIEGGYIDQLKARKSAARAGTQAPQNGEDQEEGPREFSWSTIKSKGSSQAIKSALRECQTIAKNLDPGKPATRYALFNFMNALQLLVREGEKNMSAGEAAHYVEYLHNAVARTMVRENVDISTYNNFVGLTLGPAMDWNRSARIASSLRPFNPALTLTKIKVSKPLARGKVWDEAGPVYVKMSGFVVGQDVKAINLFFNGNYLSSPKPRKPSSGYGQRPFSTKRLNGKGVFTFRVYDKFGQVWEKSYSFYPRARRFPWKSGQFQIPFTEDGDLRLDRFFTFRPGRPTYSAQAGEDLGEYTRF